MIMKPGAQGVAYRRPEKWMGDFPSNAEVAFLLFGYIFLFPSISSSRAHADDPDPCTGLLSIGDELHVLRTDRLCSVATFA